MENVIIFNSFASIVLVSILLIIGYKNLKVGISIIVLMYIYYIAYLSE
jgi:hypothetical protein